MCYVGALMVFRQSMVDTVYSAAVSTYVGDELFSPANSAGLQILPWALERAVVS